MLVTELDSFVYKFHQLWSAGHSAHLDLDTHAGRAWVGLRVQLGSVPGPPHHLPNDFHSSYKEDSPSRQRRRARRAAARQVNAAEASKKETAEEASKKETAEEASKKETAVEASKNEVAVEADVNADKPSSKSVEEKEDNDQHEDSNVAAEKAKSKEMRIADELCNDEDYEIAPIETSICSVDIYPAKYGLDRLESFRAKIEDYFANRKDVIVRVIKCEVVNYGNNVRLVTEVKVKRGWIFFFADPESNYGDLEGVKTLRHSCQDLSKCGG